MSDFTLSLFASQLPCIASATNTTFSTEPRNISLYAARDFFRHDHTPIKFTNGKRRGDNFEYATLIVGDIDNSHSENPDDWVTIEDVQAKLEAMGINYWIVTSRNHLRPKTAKEKIKEDDKTVEKLVEKPARPKFHVYLSLSTPISDKVKFVRYCKWFIRTSNGDPQVSSCAQQIFGYGDHPAPIIKSWEKGRCIDEVLTDADLATQG